MPVKTGNDDNGNTPWNRRAYKFTSVAKFLEFMEPIFQANPTLISDGKLLVPVTSENGHSMTCCIGGSEMYIQGIRTSDGELIKVPLNDQTLEYIRVAVNGDVLLWVEYRTKTDAENYAEARDAFELSAPDLPVI